MNIQTATPVEIDTEIAAIMARAAKPARAAAVAAYEVKRIREALAKPHTYYTQDNVDRAFATFKAREAERDAILAETAPYDAEFTRRGGWTRFFLVDNNGGHVHNSMRCTTCYPSTQFSWLPEFSGQDEAGVVELAGESACTVCFPSAPVDVLKRASRIELPERKAARIERERKAAEKAAKAAAAGITDAETGGPLVVRWYGTSTETLKTLRTARTWLTDCYDDWRSDRPADDIAKVVAAVAAKEGKAAETVIEEAQKRAAKRK